MRVEDARTSRWTASRPVTATFGAQNGAQGALASPLTHRRPAPIGAGLLWRLLFDGGEQFCELVEHSVSALIVGSQRDGFALRDSE